MVTYAEVQLVFSTDLLDFLEGSQLSNNLFIKYLEMKKSTN